MKTYDDILFLSRPASAHPRMAAADRAAQFAPFSALSGYGEVIGETGRLTSERPQPDPSRLEELDVRLAEAMALGCEVTVLCFEEDARKQGGGYRTFTGIIVRADHLNRRIVFGDGTCVSTQSIVDLTYDGADAAK